MKRGFRVFLIAAATVLLLCGSATAITYTFNDETNSWPGYTPYTYDYIGSPDIRSLEITISDDGYLESVVINMLRRWGTFDSLFINAGGDGKPYEAWDFYVKDTTKYTDDGATLYNVASDYVYQPTSYYMYRTGHPVAFSSGISPDLYGLLDSVKYINNGHDTIHISVLTYKFNHYVDAGGVTRGVYMHPDFVIGFTPECANDVILTPTNPVPIPPAAWLLGSGLIGLVAVRRRFKK